MTQSARQPYAGSGDLHLILDVATHNPPENVSEMELVALASRDPNEFKHVVVNLYGIDGNAFIIMGTVKTALKKAGCDNLRLSYFLSQCMVGDYENLLAVCNKWVTLTHVVPKERPGASAWSAFKSFCSKKEK